MSTAASPPQQPGGHDASGDFHVAALADNSISLSNCALVSVTLCGLPPAITSLSLAANALTSIDLSPLSSASNLTALILNGNRLTHLNLAPLAGAPSLERLWLHNNAITELDLTPLASCPKLRSLYLDANKLDSKTLDLTPLAAAGKNLRALRLGRNRLGGELDITPILQCGALSTLDACASVKLTARTDGGVPAPLPPALRRRAATVYWTAAQEEPIATDLPHHHEHSSSQASGATTPDAAAAAAEAAIVTAAAVAGPSPHLYHHHARNHHRPHPTPTHAPHSHAAHHSYPHYNPHQARQQLQHKQATLPESESLEELAKVCARPPEPRQPAVVILDFRRNQRFAAEALLTEHGGLETCVVASPAARTADALASVGALDACRVFLVRPGAAELVADLRARDASLPIVVVGPEAERVDGGAKCMSAGASCFLAEPLDDRDAIVIRGYAQKRVAAVSGAPVAAYIAKKQQNSKVDMSETALQSTVSSPHVSSRPPCSHKSLPLSQMTGGSTGVTGGSMDGSVCGSGIGSSAASSPSARPAGSLTQTTTVVSRSSAVTVLRSRPQPSPLVLGSPTSRASKGRARTGPRSLTIDFARLRDHHAGITKGRSSRIEESAIGMLFSRCGGRAFPSDFSAIATLCGLPVCASASLHAAALAWGALSTGGGPEAVSPALSPISIMAFASSGSGSSVDKDGKEGGSASLGGAASGGSTKCSISELMDQSEEHARQAEGVSFETFRDFWQNHLRNRDSESRLFNVLCHAHASEGAVPLAGIQGLASALVATRAPDMGCDEMRSLAAAVLCYEIKGLQWNLIRRQDLSRVKLCATLLAAESGMYNGCCAHLRADRMGDIRLAFAAASGKRVGCSPTLPMKDVAWLSRERGLLSERALEVIFSRFEGDMDLARFAPMWLAVNAPSSRSAIEYFFGILDADSDGYVGAADAAHFYTEKRRLLVSDGFVATAFEPIWRGAVDSVAAGDERTRATHAALSLTDIRRLSSRDATTFCQSLLFVEDPEMALVDIRGTKLSGSLAAVRAVADL